MAHHYPYEKSSSGMYLLKRDGRDVLLGTEQDIWQYIHQHHAYSVEHALRYEGYSIEPVSSNPSGLSALVIAGVAVAAGALTTVLMWPKKAKAAPAPAPPPAPVPKPAPQPVAMLTANDSGKTVPAKPNDFFYIQLPPQPWSVSFVGDFTPQYNVAPGLAPDAQGNPLSIWVVTIPSNAHGVASISFTDWSNPMQQPYYGPVYNILVTP
jgi:hypothetical protein